MSRQGTTGRMIELLVLILIVCLIAGVATQRVGFGEAILAVLLLVLLWGFFGSFIPPPHR